MRRASVDALPGVQNPPPPGGKPARPLKVRYVDKSPVLVIAFSGRTPVAPPRGGADRKPQSKRRVFGYISHGFVIKPCVLCQRRSVPKEKNNTFQPDWKIRVGRAFARRHIAATAVVAVRRQVRRNVDIPNSCKPSCSYSYCNLAPPWEGRSDWQNEGFRKCSFRRGRKWCYEPR